MFSQSILLASCLSLIFLFGCISKNHGKCLSPAMTYASAGEVTLFIAQPHTKYTETVFKAENGDKDALLALFELTPRICDSAAGSELNLLALGEIRESIGRMTFNAVLQHASPQAINLVLRWFKRQDNANKTVH